LSCGSETQLHINLCHTVNPSANQLINQSVNYIFPYLHSLILFTPVRRASGYISLFTAATKIMKVKNDHHSKFSNLSTWKEEAWKNLGLQRDFSSTTAVQIWIVSYILHKNYVAYTKLYLVALSKLWWEDFKTHLEDFWHLCQMQSCHQYVSNGAVHNFSHELMVFSFEQNIQIYFDSWNYVVYYACIADLFMSFYMFKKIH